MKRKTKRTSLVTAPRFVGGSKHDTATKLAAVRDVKQLVLQGMTKWNALGQVAIDLNVSATTMSNWFTKYEDVTVTLQRSNGNIADTLRNTHVDGIAIHSVNLRTADGNHIELTREDMDKIAILAGTIC